VPEVVLNGLTGILTGFEVKEIADTIDKLIANSDLRNRLGSEARNFTTISYGIERMVENHEGLYRKLRMSKR
jgi:glycosyltransferase involved in cell wall biosynthesis